MRNIYLSLILFLLQFLGAAYPAGAQNIAWAVSSGGTAETEVYRLVSDYQGNLYQRGWFRNNYTAASHSVQSLGNFDCFITKYNSSGQAQWVLQIGSPQLEYLHEVKFDQFGNGYFIGSFRDSVRVGQTWIYGYGSSDIFFCKIDSNGNLLWHKVIGGLDLDGHHKCGLYVNANGDCWVSGPVWGSALVGNIQIDPPLSFFISKWNSEGDVEWVKGHYFALSGSISLDVDNNIYLAGSFGDTASFITSSGGTVAIGSAGQITGSSYIAKLDSSGHALWAQEFGGVWGDAVSEISTDASGNCYVAGNVADGWSFNNPPYHHVEYGSGTGPFLAKFAPDGTFQWTRMATQPPQGGPYCYFTGLSLASNGTSYLSGFADGQVHFGSLPLASTSNNSQESAFIISYDSDGQEQWVQPVFSSAGLSYANGLVAGTDGSLYVAGRFASQATVGNITLTGNGITDAYLLKLDNITAATNANSTEFAQVSVYPNPAKNSFTVIVEKMPGNAEFYLFDLTGRQVKEVKLASQASNTIDSSQLPVGLYYYRIQSGNRNIAIGKIVLQ